MPVRIREATEEDARWFAPRLRQGDYDEFRAARAEPILGQLLDCLARSRGASFVAVSDAFGPICLFGFAPHGLLSDKAAPWAVGTPDLTRRGRALNRFGKWYCARTLEMFPVLENYVDVRNTASIRWLQGLGFQFDRPEPYGVEKRPFMRFWMTNDV